MRHQFQTISGEEHVTHRCARCGLPVLAHPGEDPSLLPDECPDDRYAREQRRAAERAALLLVTDRREASGG